MSWVAVLIGGPMADAVFAASKDGRYAAKKKPAPKKEGGQP